MYSVHVFAREFFAPCSRSEMAIASARQSSFQRLDPLSRRVIRLRHFEGLDFREIGEVVSKSETEISSIWANGMQTLMRSLA